jgi:transcriptional regulator with XRE-family HTH domain
MSTLSQSLARRGFQIGTAKIFHSLVFVKLIEYTKRNVRRGDAVNTPFTEALRKLRTEKGLSQRQLGNLLFTYRSMIARWENGSRLPDVIMIPRLAKCLGTDVSTLYHLMSESDENPCVIMADDQKRENLYRGQGSAGERTGGQRRQICLCWRRGRTFEL